MQSNNEARAFLERYIASASDEDLYDKIVNGPFQTLIQAELGLGTVVLLLDNEKSGYIERVALSSTPSADGAMSASAKPFNDIKIPRDHQQSAHVQALHTKKPVVLSDWHDMFTPALTAEQAKDNQTAAGIATSVVQPFYGAAAQNGTIIFSLFGDSSELTDSHREFFEWYSSLVSTRL